MKRIPIRRASVVLLAACSLLGLTAGRALAQLPNPVAYLKFDEGQGTLAQDSSGNGNNAFEPNSVPSLSFTPNNRALLCAGGGIRGCPLPAQAQLVKMLFS
jgi:hypothetical protein